MIIKITSASTHHKSQQEFMKYEYSNGSSLWLWNPITGTEIQLAVGFLFACKKTIRARW